MRAHIRVKPMKTLKELIRKKKKYFQKYKTVSWRTRAADLQKQRPGASGWFESLVVLGGMAVVSEPENEQQILYSAAVESTESRTELCRCDSVPSPRALEGKNKLYVR